ncbi:hypothetical protein SCNRRL3882_1988 [Streptomyces chartreusis NRRL 3882]|uniref:Uncharacterized protein n=1 Tax=Streptomyces chartreusis NRRL 3882 TaxID=1079985 RepID=A0A2N9B5A1_STRCX|nr:hypothetical protein SCNRRL3882_1988 [Streptomyces chartreusis NRRL 3882]
MLSRGVPRGLPGTMRCAHDQGQQRDIPQGSGAKPRRRARPSVRRTGQLVTAACSVPESGCAVDAELDRGAEGQGRRRGGADARGAVLAGPARRWRWRRPRRCGGRYARTTRSVPVADSADRERVESLGVGCCDQLVGRLVDLKGARTGWRGSDRSRRAGRGDPGAARAGPSGPCRPARSCVSGRGASRWSVDCLDALAGVPQEEQERGRSQRCSARTVVDSGSSPQPLCWFSRRKASAEVASLGV